MDVYKKINGIVTHLIVWGDVFEVENSDVVVCVLGCPGIPRFYQEFGAELHKGTKLPVCLIGHAGHDIVPKEWTSQNECNINSYDIKNQMDHKVQFLKHHIKTTNRLHLIGHSFGAWLLVEMLNENEDLLQKVTSVHLLFPILRELNKTPMGQTVKLLRKFHFLVLLFLSILEYIPTSIKSFMIKIGLMLYSLPSYYVERMLLYFKPMIEERALKLSYELMDNAAELNKTAMEKIKHITYVVYSPTDHWMLPRHIEELTIFEPELHVTRLDVPHAFVLKFSIDVATCVSNNLSKNNKNNKSRCYSIK